MPKHWPRTSRIAAYWLLALVTFEAVDFTLVWHIGDWFVAWIIGPLGFAILAPVFLVAGTVLVVAGIVAAWRDRSPPWHRVRIGLAPILAVAIGVGLTLPIHQGVGLALTWSSLLLNRTRYEAIIDQVRLGKIPPPQEGAGLQTSPQDIQFEVERSGLRRAAFVLPDNFLSDRQVIFYDPSIRPPAKGRPDADIEREQTTLFDGWLEPYECSRLTGPYLSCYLSRPGDRRGHG